ncbi:MAG: ATP-binding cassette domain-containing protein, partial [Bacteroidia bacterium]|nr:ATP-binding cassette domain-containing protein [Bacteroidia bacterium]
MLKADNIKKSFGALHVLKGIHLEIPQGKIYSIVGASGAGKTTLLQILGTLSKPDSGE